MSRVASRPGGSPPTLLAIAAGYAAAELAVGLLAGRFFDWGRAEALLFHAYRPWLLIALAVVIAAYDWRRRAGLYAGALLLAGASYMLLLYGLGADDPLPEILRGWAAGAVMAALADSAVQLGRRVAGRAGQAVAAVLLVLLLAGGGMNLYDRLLIGPPAQLPVGERPDLLVMTSLPIVWGEQGAFDPNSRPAAAYLALQQAFAVAPVDAIDAETLAGPRVMLIAQPRALAPEELAALDGWVREGGRLLILTDPALVWPSSLPLGDLRRPPPVGLLGPLLQHWGLALRPPEARGAIVDHLRQGSALRRLVLVAPGRFEATGPGCAVGARAYLARCRIGRGEALLVADADLLRDSAWVAPVPRGGERHARLADNPYVLIGWLDRLAGIERNVAEPVAWLPPSAERGLAVLLALLPILAALAVAAILAGRRRVH